jgi:endonuclease/exonuclease/phosphatase family metal-dependent hydrolase
MLRILSNQSAWAWQAPETDRFVVVVYNVENLFDVDKVALYDDYKPDRYQAKDLLKKLENITRVLATFKNGKGPEIVLFEEFEADQTPGTTPFDYVDFLNKYSGTTVEAMLGGNLTDSVRDLPVQALLLKSLNDAGLNKYNVAMGEYRPDPTGRTVAHVNATFSQFPITRSTTHQTDGARGILEVVHDVGGSPLVTLNNHWKSGASNVDDEKIRLGNARTLRQRLDQILKADPSTDVLIGGDFNSHYNQSATNPKMQQTAINSVAGSQGDELAIRNPTGPSLYNLWHDVPLNRRGSDVYNERWGTLMQLMITRGLYDYSGVQYVDNSFAVAAIENVNAQAGSRVPISWESIDGVSGGFSDHLPVFAEFRRVTENDKNRYLPLIDPGINDDPRDLRPIDYAATAQAKPLRSVKNLGSDTAIKSIDNIGHAFLVDATVSGNFPFRIKIFDEEFTVWAYNEKFRVSIYNRYPLGQPMVFLGELGVHKGKWQFIVRDPSWLEVK